MIDHEELEEAQRLERLQSKARAAQFRKDVQEVMALPAMWRVMNEFLRDAGADVSPLRQDNLATGHAIGWADAGGWWLNQMRKHCPEREAQMRNEARKQDKESNDE